MLPVQGDLSKRFGIDPETLEGRTAMTEFEIAKQAETSRAIVKGMETVIERTAPRQ